MIHQYALAGKTLPAPLKEVLDSLIIVVNYIKAGVLNICLFKEFCKDTNADLDLLLFCIAVRWWSKGNIANCFFELKDKIKLSPEGQKMHILSTYLMTTTGPH